MIYCLLLLMFSCVIWQKLKNQKWNHYHLVIFSKCRHWSVFCILGCQTWSWDANKHFQTGNYDANTQLYNDRQNPRLQKQYFEVPRNHELTCKQIKNFRATRIGHSPTGSALQTIRRWRAVNFPFYYSFKNGKLRELLLKCEQKKIANFSF